MLLRVVRFRSNEYNVPRTFTRARTAAADLHSGNSSMRSVVSCRVATITTDDRSQARNVYVHVHARAITHTGETFMRADDEHRVFLVEPTFYLYP